MPLGHTAILNPASIVAFVHLVLNYNKKSCPSCLNWQSRRQREHCGYVDAERQSLEFQPSLKACWRPPFLIQRPPLDLWIDQGTHAYSTCRNWPRTDDIEGAERTTDFVSSWRQVFFVAWRQFFALTSVNIPRVEKSVSRIGQLAQFGAPPANININGIHRIQVSEELT